MLIFDVVNPYQPVQNDDKGHALKLNDQFKDVRKYSDLNQRNVKPGSKFEEIETDKSKYSVIVARLERNKREDKRMSNLTNVIDALSKAERNRSKREEEKGKFNRQNLLTIPSNVCRYESCQRQCVETKEGSASLVDMNKPVYHNHIQQSPKHIVTCLKYKTLCRNVTSVCDRLGLKCCNDWGCCMPPEKIFFWLGLCTLPISLCGVYMSVRYSQRLDSKLEMAIRRIEILQSDDSSENKPRTGAEADEDHRNASVELVNLKV